MIFIRDFIEPSWEEMTSCIRGMRNPMNSWDKSDSGFCTKAYSMHMGCNNCSEDPCYHCIDEQWHLGKEDKKLMIKLAKAGSEHRKFMRMMPVFVSIEAPLYWWKEFETYRVGVAPSPADVDFNSCSTMHKITSKEFDRGDFSHEHIPKGSDAYSDTWDMKTSNMFFPINIQDEIYFSSEDVLDLTIQALNHYRDKYLKTKDKKYWWQIIQLLPSSYMQEKTISMNYEVLAHIYQQRRNHKLDEWRELCSVIEHCKYFFLIDEILKTQKKEPTDDNNIPKKALWRPIKEYYDMFFNTVTVNIPEFVFLKKTDGTFIVARFAGTVNGWRDTNNEYIDERSVSEWFNPHDLA